MWLSYSLNVPRTTKVEKYCIKNKMIKENGTLRELRTEIKICVLDTQRWRDDDCLLKKINKIK